MGTWVFGYGSLLWNPGFEYEASVLGSIRGYVRRFWQGNDWHRGTPNQPGRVVTLIEEENGITWGRAFKLKDSSAKEAIAYLDGRETVKGDYCRLVVQFHLKDAEDLTIPVLVYIATPRNCQYLGPAPLPQVADEIVRAEGVCGHNVEYLLRLAEFMQTYFPSILDDHLFNLERLVRDQLRKMGISPKSLMGEILKDLDYESSTDSEHANEDDVAECPSPEYTSLIPSRKLRCLDL